MILYHGSNMAIDVPDLTKSKPNKDFGQGFYLSKEYEQALALAEQKVRQTLQGSAIVNQFFFDESQMQNPALKVKIFDNYCEEWVRFVATNRDVNIPQPSHNFDIVYGPIADDGVTFQLKRYWAGYITIEGLMNELQYAKGITFQYFFGTLKALNLLRKV